MMRYFFKSDGSIYTVPISKVRVFEPVKQDDIVDKSNYIPNAESIRKSVITGDGLSKVGVYDDDDKMPSDFYCKFRAGKYDKAEISDYVRKHSEKVNVELAEMQENVKTSDAKQKTTKVE